MVIKFQGRGEYASSLAFCTYNFEIVHRWGTKHGNADALSRKPRHCKRSDCPDCLEGGRLICAANRRRRKRGSTPVPQGGVTVMSNNECDVDSVVSQEDTTPEPVGGMWSNWINQWSQSELKELQRAVLRLVTCNRLVNLGISKQQHLYLKTKNLI